MTTRDEQFNAAALRQALISIRKAVHFAYRTVDSEGKWDLLCMSIIAIIDDVTPNNAPGADILTAIMKLQGAWDRLGTCVGEFEPDDMTACGEYRDLLDDAIIGVLELAHSPPEVTQ